MGIETDASGFIAGVVKWVIRLLTLVVAFDALGLPMVSDFLRQVLLWIPNLIVALMGLVIGGQAAKALSNLVRGGLGLAFGFGGKDTASKIVEDWYSKGKAKHAPIHASRTRSDGVA